MRIDPDFVAEHAGRPAAALTRRDVARALLAVPSGHALVALPDLRRAMGAAGNGLSPEFWESARAALTGIESGAATVGDVQRWLESTGSEPILITRGHFVWPDEEERGPVAGEMYDLLVAHLEEHVARGAIDPDRLAAGDQAARREYEAVQDRWLNTALPDGRVPAEAVEDELDEGLTASFDEEEAFALGELRRLLADLPEPELPAGELAAAAARLRASLAESGYPGSVLRACAGFDGAPPADDTELWLAVAAGIAAPLSDLADEDLAGEDGDGRWDVDGALGEEESVLAALCTIHHADWLAAVAELSRRGPGVLASPERIARFVAESEDIDVEMDEPDDLRTTEALFRSVTPLWRHLGIVDEHSVLTPLGRWGLPRALERAWSPD
ncbi:hypothetical protein Sru01_27960 [Sphaerisporangium rufum]|uniref:Uncharacterized protein n=1 Tax=Sphaerisporangium rufum TaxID=1381558 RepID=A0A919R126_9ACTN|nr:hypothetical protein [Sphaerisporangium rufum]GII77814.1 hypothetical protein Sru01_27960 [Sphaerisporangium rufum]